MIYTLRPILCKHRTTPKALKFEASKSTKRAKAVSKKNSKDFSVFYFCGCSLKTAYGLIIYLHRLLKFNKPNERKTFYIST